MVLWQLHQSGCYCDLCHSQRGVILYPAADYVGGVGSSGYWYSQNLAFRQGQVHLVEYAMFKDLSETDAHTHKGTMACVSYAGSPGKSGAAIMAGAVLCWPGGLVTLQSLKICERLLKFRPGSYDDFITKPLKVRRAWMVELMNWFRITVVAIGPACQFTPQR